MHVTSSTASNYLLAVVTNTFSRRGFDSAEAGALAEAERLVEHHIQRLFVEAKKYAQLAGRATPNAADLLAAQEQSIEAKKLRRESKRRRRAIPLNSVDEKEQPTKQSNGTTNIPEYAYDGAPSLPDDWTYRIAPSVAPADPPATVTAGLFEFIKLTATERGDIPPELGLVDYRHKRAGKRWSTKGVGVE